jgi:hypothetical protein
LEQVAEESVSGRDQVGEEQREGEEQAGPPAGSTDDQTRPLASPPPTTPPQSARSERGSLLAIVVIAAIAGVILGAAGGLALLGPGPGESPSVTGSLASPLPSTAGTTLPSTPTGIVKLPASLDATGREDVTREFQAYLDGVPDGSTIVFPERAEYRVEGQLLLVGRTALEFDGNGSTIRSEERAGTSVWRLVGSSRLKFSDLTILGANDRAGTSDAYLPELQHEHAFDLRGSTDIEITNVRMQGQNGDCVYVGPAMDGAWSERVAITGNDCRSNGRMGVAITGGRDVLIDGNTFDEIAIYTLDIEPNEAEIPQGGERVTFTNNTVGTGSHSDVYTPYFFAASGWGIASDVTIRNNLLTGQPLWMVASPGDSPFRRLRFTISDNESEVLAEGREVMDFVGHEDLVVTNNVQPMATGIPLVTVKRSCRAMVEGNQFPGGEVEVEVTDEAC